MDTQTQESHKNVRSLDREAGGLSKQESDTHTQTQTLGYINGDKEQYCQSLRQLFERFNISLVNLTRVTFSVLYLA